MTIAEDNAGIRELTQAESDHCGDEQNVDDRALELAEKPNPGGRLFFFYELVRPVLCQTGSGLRLG
jgi:hypothetical protein